MNLLDIIREARRHLQENGRVSLRVLRRQFELEEGAQPESRRMRAWPKPRFTAGGVSCRG